MTAESIAGKIAVVYFYFIEIKFQTDSILRITCEDCGCPVVAIDGAELSFSIEAETRNWQEDGIACLLARYLIAIDTVIRRPLLDAVVRVCQLFALCFRRHAPFSTPVGVGGIVRTSQLRFSVAHRLFG